MCGLPTESLLGNPILAKGLGKCSLCFFYIFRLSFLWISLTSEICFVAHFPLILNEVFPKPKYLYLFIDFVHLKLARLKLAECITFSATFFPNNQEEGFLSPSYAFKLK